MEIVEQSEGRDSYLTESDSLNEEEGSHTIHGVALGHRDITKSKNGSELFWTAEGLQMAAESLIGRPLVVDHEDSAYAVVGEVTGAKFEEGVGIRYKARLEDDELAEKIRDDLLEVSVKIFRPEDEELEERQGGVLEVDRAKIDNLSIVAKGEAPSNHVEYGSPDDFSKETCLEDFESEEQESEEEVEELDLESAAEVVAEESGVAEEEVYAFMEAICADEGDREAVDTVVNEAYRGMGFDGVEEAFSESEVEEEEAEDGEDESEKSLLDEVVLN